MKLLRSYICIFVLFFVTFGMTSCMSIDHMICAVNYERYNDYILHDNIDDVESYAAMIDDALQMLPSQHADAIKTHWKIVIVKPDALNTFNMGEHYRVDGLTEYKTRIIKLHQNFTIETVLHEFGHVVDGMLKFPSGKSEFYHLYREHWQQYIDCFNTTTAFHQVMNSSEFFASMFQEYMTNGDLVKKQIPEIFSYFDNIKNANASALIVHGQFNIDDYQPRLSELEINKLIDGLSDERIVPVDTTMFVPGNQSNIAQDAIKMIVNKIENIDNEEPLKQSYSWQFNVPIDYEDYESIVSYFEMYYGVFDKNFLDITTNNFSSTMTLYMDVIRSMEAERKILTKNIGNLVSTMYNGDASAMAVSFAEYINKQYNIHMNYIDKNMNEIEPGSDISAYNAAVLFQKMCAASGLRCDIISGYIDSGVPHVWNRILIEDGSYRYFNVYFYYDGIVNVDEYHYAVDYAVNWIVSK